MEKIYELLRTWMKEAEQPTPKTAPQKAKDKEAIPNDNMRRPSA